MKHAIFEKSFIKEINKLPTHLAEKFDERLKMFLINQNDPLLHIHKLSGKLSDTWSMNVTGDIRALFKKESGDVVVFIAIGTHSYLFGK